MKLGDNTLAYDVCVPLLYRTRLVLQLRVAVGRRGLGPREQVEQRTQHALSEVQYSLVLPVRVVHVLMYMLHVVVGLKTSILRSIYYS